MGTYIDKSVQCFQDHIFKIYSEYHTKDKVSYFLKKAGVFDDRDFPGILRWYCFNGKFKGKQWNILYPKAYGTGSVRHVNNIIRFRDKWCIHFERLPGPQSWAPKKKEFLNIFNILPYLVFRSYQNGSIRLEIRCHSIVRFSTDTGTSSGLVLTITLKTTTTPNII